MSDARWFEVNDDIEDAVKHFSRASEIFRMRDLGADNLDGDIMRMGFMHAMQSGHTSLESGLLRILAMLGEDKPEGETCTPT